MATTDTPDKVVAPLTVGEHEAQDEVHEPRTPGSIGSRRRRPIEGLDANKRMARRKVVIANSRRRIHEARQLGKRRQSLALLAPHHPIGTLKAGSFPGRPIARSRVLASARMMRCPVPHLARLQVQHGFPIGKGIVKLSEFDQKLGKARIHNSLFVQHSCYRSEVENRPNST